MKNDEEIEKLVQKIVSLVSPDEDTNNAKDEQYAGTDDDSDGENMQILNDLNDILTNLHKYSKYLDYDYIKALIHTLKAVVLDKETKLKNQNTIIDEGVAINDLYKVINVIQAIDVEGDYDILSEGAVIMGINGCGKSTLAKAICNLVDGCLISANKNNTISSLIPIKKTKEKIYSLERNKALETISDDNLRLLLTTSDSENELEGLLSELLQNKLTSIMSKRDTSTKTDLDLVIDLWNGVLREDYKTNNKLFINDTFEIKIYDGTKVGYDIAGMSDGEKDILYIITKTIYGVKTQQKKCVIVDEPEIHMHKSVLPTLWTELEKECDCPFIYFTHDIDFAETRKYNKFWLKEFNYNTNIMKLDKLDGSIPPELYKLLGVTKNILFCEGKIDGQLYSLLFPDRLVIKAGNCDKVIQYTKTYNEKQLGKAIGIIDRDYHTDEYSDKLHEKEKPTIFVLNVAEVENIFLQEDVLREYINDSNKVKQIKIDIANQMLEDLPTISIKAVEFHIAKELKLQTTIERQKNEISNLNIDDMIQAKYSFFQELANQVKNNPDNRLSYRNLIKYYNKKGLREIVENKIKSNDFKEDIMNQLTNNNQLKIFLTNAFPPELRKFLPEDLIQSTDDSSPALTPEHIYATETIDSLPIQTSSIDETQQSVDHSTENGQNIIIDEPITQENMTQNDNKILVSFIGDSSYNDATYTSTMFDGNSKSKYVQSVIVNKILSLEENDKVVIFRTDNPKVENNYNNLKEQLAQKSIVITDVIIEEGDDEEEVWSIFNKIYTKVIEFGNVYFDITYSFRSIPLLVSEILNFASTMHDSKVKAIYYAKDSGRDKYNIINLLPVVDIQEYTRLASDFKKYGRVKGLGEQYDDTNNNIRQALIDFDNYIQFNNLAKLKEGEYLRDIFADIESVAESDTEIPLSFIKNELRETLRSYGFSCGSSDSYDSWDNIKAAILWCQEHDMFIQAFSLAREYVNLYLAQYLGVNNYMPSNRNDVSQLNDFCFDKFKAAGFVEAISLIIEQTGYSRQTELRNTINDIRSQVNSVDNSFDEKSELILSNADVLSISYKTCNDKLINTTEKYEIEDFLKKCKNIKNKMGHTDITNDVTDMIGYANQLLATMNNVMDRIIFAKKSIVQPLVTEYKTNLKELRNNLDHCKSGFSQNDYELYKNYDFNALFNMLPLCS